MSAFYNNSEPIAIHNAKTGELLAEFSSTSKAVRSLRLLSKSVALYRIKDRMVKSGKRRKRVFCKELGVYITVTSITGPPSGKLIKSLDSCFIRDKKIHVIQESK